LASNKDIGPKDFFEMACSNPISVISLLFDSQPGIFVKKRKIFQKSDRVAYNMATIVFVTQKNDCGVGGVRYDQCHSNVCFRPLAFSMPS
jgi:hypothetical protein